MPQVGTGSMPSGGQEVAMVIGGYSAPQKNAQKKAKKKNTSETMNRAMPMRRPLDTTSLWAPLADFAQHVAPPAEHGVEDAEEAQQRHPAAHRHAVHPHARRRR